MRDAGGREAVSEGGSKEAGKKVSRVVQSNYILFLLFQVVLQGTDEIAARAVELIKETYTNLGPRLRASQVQSMQFSRKKLLEYIFSFFINYFEMLFYVPSTLSLIFQELEKSIIQNIIHND